MNFILFLISILLGAATYSWGLSCCGGEGPRSYTSLQELQTLDFSVTSSMQDIYGWYDSQGSIVEKAGTSDLALLIHSIARLQPNAEVFGRIPLISRTYPTSGGGDTLTGLGDISWGVRFTLFRSLFLEDPFPTVSLVASTKAPSGQWRNGKGTGNGLWENSLGLSFRKDYLRWVGTIDATWTYLSGDALTVFGNDQQLTLTESMSYELNRKLYLGGGSNQIWSLRNPQRNISALGFGQLFLTQFTSLVGSFTWSLPIDGFGQNQPLTRTASVSIRYGFY